MGLLLLILYAFGLSGALLSGRAQEAGAAMLAGAEEALRFCLELGGGLCLWSAILGLLEAVGAASWLGRLLRPVLGRLFPRASQSNEALEALTENVSANLLGLGNAATPAGLRAARAIAALGGAGREELCLLVVLNTASLQLLPTTAATLRASLGAAAPFDILPAVWFSTLCSLAAGLGAAAVLRRLWR